MLELLASELNAKGGVLGKKVEVITEDDGGDPRTSALAAQRLSTQGIVAVVGTYGSAVCEASQNIFDEAKNRPDSEWLDGYPSYGKGLEVFLQNLVRVMTSRPKWQPPRSRKLKVKKIAILHDNTTYSKGLADETKGLLKGIEVVFYDALTPGERDYTAILTKLKAAQPDAVFFPGYYPEARTAPSPEERDELGGSPS